VILPGSRRDERSGTWSAWTGTTRFATGICRDDSALSTGGVSTDHWKMQLVSLGVV